MFKLEMGITVKSRMTGFVGMISARSENLYGCNRYYVSPRVDKEGKIPDGHWFDENDIILIKGPIIKTVKVERGGPISKIK